MPEAEHAPPLRWHWPAAVLAVVAGLVAIAAHEWIFPALSWNRDEPVYLWHVELLRQGQLTAALGDHPDLFANWLSAVRDGQQFTQYTLGWPLALLGARLLTGTAASALPLSAALAVAGTYALAYELTGRRRTATLAGGLLVASPILALQSGVFLGYTFTLGLGFAAGALLLSGVRRGRPWRFVAAGALLGWVFLTRPYDALLWGGAFALAALVTAGSPRSRVLRGATVTAATALPFVVAALLYNRHVTGQLLEFPITAADPLDGFGFGRRRLMPGFEAVDYDVGKGLKASAKNALVLPWFLVGGYLGVAVAAWGLWRSRASRVLPVTLLVGAAFPLGYFVFWGTHLSSLASRISGPIYFVPLYGVVCILAAIALEGWWSNRRRLAVAAIVVLGLATLPGAITRFAVNREISVEQRPWRESVAALDQPSIVFVADTGRYLLYTNPFSANPPDLDGRILFATAGSPEMLDLIADHPGRRPYLQIPSVAAPELGPREDPQDLDVVLEPVEVVRGEAVVVMLSLTPPPGARFAHVEVTAGEGTVERSVELGPAPSTVEVPVGRAASGSDGLVVADRGTLRATVGYGSTAAEAAARPSVRRSAPYRLAGSDVEVLLPSLPERLVQVGDRQQWRHVWPLAELDLAVRRRP